MYYAILDKSKQIYGLFEDDGCNVELENTVFMDVELFNYISNTFGAKIYKGEINDNVLSIENKDMFEVQEVVSVPYISEMDKLKKQVEELSDKVKRQEDLIEKTISEFNKITQ